MSAHQTATFTIHPSLAYTQASDLHIALLSWDLRTERFRLPIHSHIYDYATTPPIPKLTVLCGIFEGFKFGWEIMVSNPDGITILDVLKGIRGCLDRQITREEWEQISLKQKDRISIVFHQRWRSSALPQAARAHGVLRQDCLFHYVIFKGISPVFVDGETDRSCVLTLGRLPAAEDRANQGDAQEGSSFFSIC